jgi:hypothetical protein
MMIGEAHYAEVCEGALKRFLVREADKRISVIGLSMGIKFSGELRGCTDSEPVGKQCAVIYGNAFIELRGVIITKCICVWKHGRRTRR